MHTRRSIGCCLALLSAAPAARGGQGAAYSATEAARLRREITLENWDDGGERSRFAYLNISQIFPVAVVHRAGAILPLPAQPTPAVGSYTSRSRSARR